MSNAKKIRTAVLGIGYLGQFHAQKHRILANASNDLEFVAVCDPFLGLSEQVARDQGVDHTRRPEDLVGRVDAVTISAATEAHFDLGKLFLSNGVHVLMEKPLASNSEQARELLALAQEKNLIFQIGFSERMNPAFETLRARDLNFSSFECRRAMPFQERTRNNDVVTDLMIHDLDLLQALKPGLKYELLHVQGGRFLTEKLDYAQVSLKFEDGSLAHLLASRIESQVQRTLSAWSDQHLFHLDFQLGALEEIRPGQKNIAIEKLEYGKSDNLLAETKIFFDSVRFRKPTPVPASLGLRPLEICEEILRAIG